MTLIISTLEIIVKILAFFYLAGAVYFVLYKRDRKGSFEMRYILAEAICIILTALIVILVIQKREFYIHVICLILFILTCIEDYKTVVNYEQKELEKKKE